jgi:protein ImuA
MSSASNQHDVLTRLRDEIRRIERRPARRAGALPSGVAAVDALLPGGFPCGALSELRGGPASGKTAVALSVVARLGAGALAAFIDGRGELYPPAAAAMGVDLGRLLIVRPPPGEAGARLALWAAEALLGSGAFAVVTVDVALDRPWRGVETSLRRLVTAAEQGGAVGLWLSPAGGAVRAREGGAPRPPAVVRLDLRVEGRRVVAARADGPASAAPPEDGRPRASERPPSQALMPRGLAATRLAGGGHAA